MATPQAHALPPTHRSLPLKNLGLVRGLLASRFFQALSYPHSVDQYLQLSSRVLSVDTIRAEVIGITRETSDVVTLTISPNDNFRGYQAGQYVALTVEIDGVRHTRCFSISSAPERGDGLLTLTVKARAQGGLVSPYLVEHARAGLRVEVSAPLGDFVLPAQLPERLLFISGGSGITPCMSMLRSLAKRGYRGAITFLHYARSPEDVIFQGELRELALEMPGLSLVIETESELGRVPSLDEECLARIVPHFDSVDCWVCGPAPLMDAVSRAYASRGAEAKVRHERFVSPTAGGDTAGEAGTLTFTRSHKLVEGDARRTLLEQAEDAGVRPKSGCRMGICQTCRCKKRAGVTKDIRTGALSTEDGDDIRLCVSVPVGDVTLDL
jgi:stearoyl-CoA 9-desaturase NADPH oxidoreductase